MYHILSLSTAWDASSVWDLPIDSMAQAPTIEQMQQLEKSKAAKVNCISAYFSVFFDFVEPSPAYYILTIIANSYAREWHSF